MDISFSSKVLFFSIKVCWLVYHLSQSLSTVSDGHRVSQLPVICKIVTINHGLGKNFVGGDVLYWDSSVSRQIPTSLQMEPSKKSPDRSNNDSSMRIRLWMHSRSVLPLLWAAQLIVFSTNAGCSRLSWTWKGGLGQVRTPQSSYLVLRVDWFSWIGAPHLLQAFP